MYLLDCDICSYYLKGVERVVKRVDSLNPLLLMASEHTMAELRVVAVLGKTKRINHQAIDQFRYILGRVIAVQGADWDLFARLKAQLVSKGDNFGDLDILLAAVSINNDLVVVSNNKKHFEPMAQKLGLKWENWAADNSDATSSGSSA